MQSGTVTNTTIVDKKVRIDVVEDRGRDKFSVHVELTAAAKCVQPDDAIWLRGEYALWTPKLRCWHDYKLKRIGEVIEIKGKPEPIPKAEPDIAKEVDE